MARKVRGRPPLWSLLMIVPGSLFLAPTAATWFGFLIQFVLGPNNSLVWLYAVNILPIRFAFLILLSFAGLKLWQYLADREVGRLDDGGEAAFGVAATDSPSIVSWLVVSASVLAGLILRTVALDQSFTYDEIFSLRNFVELPNLDKVVNTYSSTQNHILYSVCAWIVARLLGEGEIALRLPAVVFGVASLYAIFLLGRELFGWKVGAISSLLMAFSVWHIYYSQEARGYSATAFFAIASTIFLVRGMRRNDSKSWLPYIACVVFGLYSNLTFVLLIVAHLGFVVHSAAKLRYCRLQLRGLTGFSVAWLAAIAVSLALYVPVLKNVLSNVYLLMGREVVGVENIIVAYVAAVGNIVAWLSGDWYALSELAIVAAVGIGLVRLGQPPEADGIKRLFGWILAASLVAILLLATRHFFFTRFFLVVLPFLILAMANGAIHMASIVRPNLRTGVLVGIVLLLLVTQMHGLIAYYQSDKQDIRGVAKYLKQEANEGDMVVVAGLGWQELAHYYDRQIYHPSTIPELSKLATKQESNRVFFVLLLGPEEKGPLAKWARSRASRVRFFPPVRTGPPVGVIEVLEVHPALVVSP